MTCRICPALKPHRIPCSLVLFAAALVPLVAASCAISCQAQFKAPTSDELAMTSLPGYPGAPAVVLFREEITEDDLHLVQHYDRIKILTEEGKKYADVELPYVTTTGPEAYDPGNDKSVDSISARTIHPDGTIIPFAGKPYLKVIEKGQNFKYQAKVFTLPDVQVGSIIEYRYTTRIDDEVFEAPQWYIQGDLYVKSAHYAWYPTIEDLVSSRDTINAINWFPVLPPGVQIERHELPADSTGGNPKQILELSIKDVPPVKHEEFMPPTDSYTYRVLFTFQPYRTPDEFWKARGKDWSKDVNSFADPNSDLRSATAAIIAGATTQDQKLRKIYAAVMALENSDYTREHNPQENKENGLNKSRNAGDVLRNKRGDSVQLTELFVGMARAAGMNADFMLVPDRSKDLFTPEWLSFRQFDSMIVIVNVDGKDLFFDPGSRDCAYGHLAWEHTFVDGLRQKAGDTAFDKTAGDNYTSNVVARVANLNMGSNSHIFGRIDLTFNGDAALRWRQTALRGDEAGLKHDLRIYLENMIPKSLEVKDVTVNELDAYEQPLKVTYMVDGTLGVWTGKRLIMPADIFLAGAKATFPDQTRDVAVYFPYPQFVRDALRISFPASFSIEAAPPAAKFKMENMALYSMNVTTAPDSFTTRRDFVDNTVIFLPHEYPQLRSFYSQFEANDEQSVILKSTGAVAATATSSTTPSSAAN
jgi:transglutaminase-like putative cysteine protease